MELKQYMNNCWMVIYKFKFFVSVEIQDGPYNMTNLNLYPLSQCFEFILI